VKIVYGIHGYGRGHATRALTVLPELTKRHEVLILAGGDAYDLLSLEYPVQKLPTLRHYYGRGHRNSRFHTVWNNLPVVRDLLLRGKQFQKVRGLFTNFQPDVAISDAEAFTHRVARALKIPRIGFDHFGIMVYCKPWVPWYDHFRMAGAIALYRFLFGQPERVIVSSFYPAPARVEGVQVAAPLLRKEIRETPVSDGEHLLVYLNKGESQFTPRLRHALLNCGRSVRVYGLEGRRSEGPLSFHSSSNLPFVEDLASCQAVISTAGNQLVGEAIYYQKPMLVMPESTVEQRLNARQLEALGLGQASTFERVDASLIKGFLARRKEYVERMRALAQQSWHEALDLIEQYLAELAPQAAQGTPSEARHAGA
jgi:uncharacterized protein (TIGR00661 family)